MTSIIANGRSSINDDCGVNASFKLQVLEDWSSKQRTVAAHASKTFPWNPWMHDRRSASNVNNACAWRVWQTFWPSCRALSFSTNLTFPDPNMSEKKKAPGWTLRPMVKTLESISMHSDRFGSGDKSKAWHPMMCYMSACDCKLFLEYSIMWIVRLFLRLVFQNHSVHLVETCWNLVSNVLASRQLVGEVFDLSNDCGLPSSVTSCEMTSWRVDKPPRCPKQRTDRMDDKGMDSLKTDWMPIPIGTWRCQHEKRDGRCVSQSVQRWKHIIVNAQMIQ